MVEKHVELGGCSKAAVLENLRRTAPLETPWRLEFLSSTHDVRKV